MDIIIFIIKAVLFSMAYSFVAGLVVMALALPFAATLSEREPSGAIGRVIGGLLIVIVCIICAGQGAILAAAVELSLEAVPGRWKLLWYWVGAFSSIPSALTEGAQQMASNSSSTPTTRIGIMIGPVFFVVFAIWPSLIPWPLASIGTFLAVK